MFLIFIGPSNSISYPFLEGTCRLVISASCFPKLSYKSEFVSQNLVVPIPCFQIVQCVVLRLLDLHV
jgi:hypothetical protein